MRNDTATHPSRPRPSGRLAIDPYRIDEMTWTRTELLRARGQLPTTPPTAPVRMHRRRRSGSR